MLDLYLQLEIQEKVKRRIIGISSQYGVQVHKGVVSETRARRGEANIRQAGNNNDVNKGNIAYSEVFGRRLSEIDEG